MMVGWVGETKVGMVLGIAEVMVLMMIVMKAGENEEQIRIREEENLVRNSSKSSGHCFLVHVMLLTFLCLSYEALKKER